ncbi:MAG TPA: hypothetical protein VGO92_09065 [Acidimicrobiales bacterium]|jgi:hypothetical protein|nr:hypothetical protein [Acidimicrobiales bacterium]
MSARGRPVLAAIAGFFFFLFLGLELAVFGVLAVSSVLLAVLPVAGLVLGVLWAFTAPLGPRRPPPGWRERTSADG